MRYLSVCSGIEAATVAWHGLGWEPAAFSEIERFPSDVLKYHYPNVPNVGDMTLYKDWNIGSIGLLVGGTPCQSFSVAGLRKGLDDPRGNLALVYCGLLDHFRPRWFVWENVPGVLSSNGGRDFGSFLGAVAELGYGFAYRVLDAQFFGVAQRRRRVFVVGCLGDWRAAASVLFERQSLRGDTAPSREKGQKITCTPEGISGTVSRKWSKGTGGPAGDEHYNLMAVYEMHGQDSRVREVGDVCTTVTQKYGTGGGNVPVTMSPISYRKSRRAQSTEDCETWVEDEVTNTINLFDQGDVRATQAIVQPISIHPHCIGRGPDAGPQGKEYLMDGSAYCMDSRGKPQAVVQPIPLDLRNAGRDPEKHDEMNRQGVGVGEPGDPAHTVTSAFVNGVVAPTITSSNDPSRSPQSSEVTQQVAAVHAASMAVRRLTPVECERLQGFPDKYTDIRPNCPDGPRYKALGNSMAVPVMAWIGKRIKEVDELSKQETS